MAKRKRLTPAVAYVRMSTDKQSDSPARQRGEIEAMAKRDGYRIIRWYEDHGKTGTESANRPQFQSLLRDASARGDFHAVQMYEQSRGSREEILDAMIHWRTLAVAGVKQITVLQGEIDIDDLGGLIKAVVTQHEARSESLRTADRSVSGKMAKARNAQHFGGAPFGYDRVMIDDSGNEVRRVHFHEKFQKPKGWTARLIPSADHEAVAGVRRAFRLFRKGVSYRQIARELNERELTTTYGKPFIGLAVRRLLENPVYAGVYRFGHVAKGKLARADEVIVRDAHPAIVSRSNFDAVQKIIKSNTSTRGPSENGRYLLAGIVYCIDCGRRMYGHSQFHRPDELFTQYTCGSRYERDTCECETRPYVNGHNLERAVIEYVKRHILSEENREHLLEAARRFGARSEPPPIEVTQLEDVRREIRDAERNLIRAKSDDLFDIVARGLHDLKEREAELLTRLSKRNANRPPSPEAAAALASLPEIRDNLHLTDRVKLSVALHDTIRSIRVGHRLLEGYCSRKEVRETFGFIEFESSVYSGEPIEFDGEFVNSDKPWRRIARIIIEAGRPMSADELRVAMGYAIPSPVYRYAAIAVKAGLVAKNGRYGGFKPIAS